MEFLEDREIEGGGIFSRNSELDITITREGRGSDNNNAGIIPEFRWAIDKDLVRGKGHYCPSVPSITYVGTRAGN